MIYPPIKELIDKVGNRYSLVVVTAKRAREIAHRERILEKERELAPEPTTLESRLKRLERNSNKSTVKPIVQAIHEVYDGKVYFVQGDAQDAEVEENVTEAPTVIEPSEEAPEASETSEE